jgi:hypothetical protein
VSCQTDEHDSPKEDVPDSGESEGCVDVNEQRGDLIRVVEHQAVSPCDDSTGKGPVREAVASDEESRAGGEDPDEQEVENGDVIAEVEEKVVPRSLLVLVDSYRKEIESLQRVRNVYPPARSDY